MAVLRDTVGPLDSHPGHQPTTQEPYTTEPFMDQDYMEYDNEPRRRRRDVTGGLVSRSMSRRDNPSLMCVKLSRSMDI